MDLPQINTTLTREALLEQLRGEPQHSVMAIERGAVNVEARTADLAYASEIPVAQWFGNEILDMSPKSMRSKRINNGAALLLNHDRDQQIGVVEKTTVGGDKKARATVRFSRSSLGQEIMQDVADGIRTKVSVGYRVYDMVLESKSEDLSTYRITDWEPFEISIVSIPADDSVGVGRSMRGTHEEESSMDPKQAAAPAGGAPAGTTTLAANFGASDAAARENERALIAQRNADIIALGSQWRDQGGPDLALKAIGDPNMTVDAFRAAMLDVLAKNRANPIQTGRLEADRQGGSHQQQGGSVPYGMSPREMLSAAALKAFRGIGAVMGMKDHEVAYRAGMWAMAAIHGNANAMRWCQDAGVELRQGTREQLGFNERVMNEGVFTSAGWLVPMEMESAIIANREEYGVARRICNVVPMSSSSTSFPRVTSDTSAYFVGEGTAGTEGNGTGDQVTLTLKDCMSWTNIGKSTAQDTVISLAEFVAREQARAFAVKEDACLIIGDGTSTYGGMMGLKTLLDNSSYSGGKIAATSAHDTFPEIDVTDLTNLLGIMPVYARAGARWLCSGVFEALVFGKQKLNAGGNTVQTVQGKIVEGDYAGFPVTVAHHMPAGAATTYNGAAILLLGNFNLGVAFGSGSGMMMTVDPYTLAHQNLSRVITTERIDINCHGVNKSTTVAGPIVGLHGTT